MAVNATRRVLLVFAELAPWIQTGGLADVAAALPPALRALGVDARVLIAGYPPVRDAMQDAQVVATVAPASVALPAARLVAGRTATGVPVYVIDCPALYMRAGDPYRDPGGREWPDNHLRFALLSNVAAQMALDTLTLDWVPHVLHCHDWHAGLAPLYLRLAGGGAARSLFTIHNIGYQGLFPSDVLAALALPSQVFAMEGVEFYGRLSFLKAGIYYADALTTVSPTHAQEIQTRGYGFGLHGLLQRRRDVLTGILNGVDVEQWNPASDPHLAQRYDRDRLDDKPANKAALQRRLRLPAGNDLPLLGVVGRLTHQKGLDLLLPILREVCDLPAQVVVLGAGDTALEEAFLARARDCGNSCAVVIGFDEPLAHVIEAGADMFIMPSRYEPCGLSQMYSLRYGTPPVVRATGGLADSVIDCDAALSNGGEGNGFVFDEATPLALLNAIKRAVRAWREPLRWRELQRRGMRIDFSWRASAQRYCDLYQTLSAAA